MIEAAKLQTVQNRYFLPDWITRMTIEYPSLSWTILDYPRLG